MDRTVHLHPGSAFNLQIFAEPDDPAHPHRKVLRGCWGELDIRVHYQLFVDILGICRTEIQFSVRFALKLKRPDPWLSVHDGRQATGLVLCKNWITSFIFSPHYHQNFPFWIFHCSFGSTGSMTSQCSASLPSSTRTDRSMLPAAGQGSFTRHQHKVAFTRDQVGPVILKSHPLLCKLPKSGR